MQKTKIPWADYTWNPIRGRTCSQHIYMLLSKRKPWIFNWPRNVWQGATVESQKWLDERVWYLFGIMASKRFISIEPMLERIIIPARWLSGLDWIICGCESGPGRRPFNPDWARSLRDQCQEAEIPFFYKQGPDKNGRIVDMPELDGRVWDQVPE